MAVAGVAARHSSRHRGRLGCSFVSRHSAPALSQAQEASGLAVVPARIDAASSVFFSHCSPAHCRPIWTAVADALLLQPRDCGSRQHWILLVSAAGRRRHDATSADACDRHGTPRHGHADGAGRAPAFGAGRGRRGPGHSRHRGVQPDHGAGWAWHRRHRRCIRRAEDARKPFWRNLGAGG